MMEYRRLGNSGVEVSVYCLGCMMFGSQTPEEESIRMIHKALDAGINFLDTADVYSTPGTYDAVSEQIVGKALQGRREAVVLATKFFGKMSDGPNSVGASRYRIMQCIENSLRRLQTDHIDLYQVHRPDWNTPVEETFRALDDLVRQGKVRYVGVSEFPAWKTAEICRICREAGWISLTTSQPQYNLLYRGIEQEVLPCCRYFGVGVLPWAPLAAGMLTGKYAEPERLPEVSRAARNPRMADRLTVDARTRIAALQQLADEAKMPLGHYAMAWVRSRPGVTAPIIGPRTMEQLEAYLQSLECALPPEHEARIDAVAPPGTNAYVFP